MSSVSTDSEEYADIARYYGAECPYLRGVEASSGTAMEEDILRDMEANLPALGIPMPDLWARLKPTNPFRSLGNLQQAIELLKSNPEIDSVRHVTAAETRLCVVNADGYLEPLSADWPNDRSVIRRTEFPIGYQVFDLDVLRHKNVGLMGSGYMGRTMKPIVGEAITALDINDNDDFELVKTIIESKPWSDLVRRNLVEIDRPPYPG